MGRCHNLNLSKYRSPLANPGTSYHGQLYLEGDHIMHVSGRLGRVGPEEDGDVGEDVLEG